MLTDRLPRVRLGHLPTPLHEMPRLSKALGGPRLLVKRDDQTGLAGGGNKTRKLEFSVAEALRRGADTLVTLGAVQSIFFQEEDGIRDLTVTGVQTCALPI